MEQFLIKLLFISMSFHSPNIPGESFDWMLSGGIKGDQNHYEVLSERQGGQEYYGLDLYQGYGSSWWWTEVKIFKRTSRGIDTQKFGEFFPRYGWLKIGSVAVFDRWKDHEQRMALQAERGGLKGTLEAQTFKKTSAVELSYSKILMEKDYKRFKAQVEPKLSYRKEKHKEFWSAELRLLLGASKDD